MRKSVVVGLAFVALSGGVSGCGDRTEVDSIADTPAEEAPATQYDLPFGLDQVEGTAAVARPVVAEQPPGRTPDSAPAIGLRAAYRVTGSPQEVMTSWSEQFAELGLGDVTYLTPSMLESDGPDPWLELSTYSLGSYGNHANAELWSTTAGPLLLIEIDRSPDVVAVPVDAPDLPTLPDAPAPVPMPTTLASGGEAAFGPPGAEVDLPPGAEQVMPSVPSISGTGGEVVMLTTDDPLGTVRSLVQEAYDWNEAQPAEPGSIEGPHAGEVDGSTTAAAEFSSGAGGWGFSVLASQAPEDELASVWVRTYAD
jgi:hypothetical protein